MSTLGNVLEVMPELPELNSCANHWALVCFFNFNAFKLEDLLIVF